MSADDGTPSGGLTTDNATTIYLLNIVLAAMMKQGAIDPIRLLSDIEEAARSAPPEIMDIPLGQALAKLTEFLRDTVNGA